MLEGMWVFAILIMFYFFYRLNRFESYLLEYREETDKECRRLRARVADLEEAAQQGTADEKDAAKRQGESK